MNLLVKNSIKRLLHATGIYKRFVPAPGSVHFGDLYRTSPFSTKFGYDRGGPVDRVYIEQFLEENKAHIKGRVLEVADNNYTRLFGQNVTQSDILFVNDTNPKATIIADLNKPMLSYYNSFDCIIMTQTLQFVYDLEQAMENCFNLLKPGGRLLITVPGISNIGKDPWEWYWSFSTFSVRRLLERKFGDANVVVQSHGNVLAASAFLYGMGRSDIKLNDLRSNDKSYQVIITASASK